MAYHDDAGVEVGDCPITMGRIVSGKIGVRVMIWIKRQWRICVIKISDGDPKLLTLKCWFIKVLTCDEGIPKSRRSNHDGTSKG